MRKIKREIKKILHSGKQQNLESQPGNQNGVRVGQDGILNALQWRARLWEIKSIFILEGLI